MVTRVLSVHLWGFVGEPVANRESKAVISLMGRKRRQAGGLLRIPVGHVSTGVNHSTAPSASRS